MSKVSQQTRNHLAETRAILDRIASRPLRPIDRDDVALLDSALCEIGAAVDSVAQSALCAESLGGELAQVVRALSECRTALRNL